jgi:hypothetical protein
MAVVSTSAYCVVTEILLAVSSGTFQTIWCSGHAKRLDKICRMVLISRNTENALTKRCRGRASDLGNIHLGLNYFTEAFLTQITTDLTHTEEGPYLNYIFNDSQQLHMT